MTTTLVEATRRARLGNLRNGALFRTPDGVLAVKSEYRYSDGVDTQSLCVLLESGEYAHFPKKDMELVYELKLTKGVA